MPGLGKVVPNFVRSTAYQSAVQRRAHSRTLPRHTPGCSCPAARAPPALPLPIQHTYFQRVNTHRTETKCRPWSGRASLVRRCWLLRLAWPPCSCCCCWLTRPSAALSVRSSRRSTPLQNCLAVTCEGSSKARLSFMYELYGFLHELTRCSLSCTPMAAKTSTLARYLHVASHVRLVRERG
jgi:hypothetical protein